MIGRIGGEAEEEGEGRRWDVGGKMAKKRERDLLWLCLDAHMYVCARVWRGWGACVLHVLSLKKGTLYPILAVIA